MMEMIFGTAVINAWIVYNLKSETKMTKLDFIESIIEKFTKIPLTNTTNIPPRASAELDQGTTKYHILNKESRLIPVCQKTFLGVLLVKVDRVKGIMTRFYVTGGAQRTWR
jgi:hypothetical protein